MALKPAILTFEEAAAIPQAGVIALRGIRDKGQVQSGQKVLNRKDLQAITELCESGKIVPVIDRRYSFSEIPEAFRNIGEGRAKGKIVITLGN